MNDIFPDLRESMKGCYLGPKRDAPLLPPLFDGRMIEEYNVVQGILNFICYTHWEFHILVPKLLKQKCS